MRNDVQNHFSDSAPLIDLNQTMNTKEMDVEKNLAPAPSAPPLEALDANKMLRPLLDELSNIDTSSIFSGAHEYTLFKWMKINFFEQDKLNNSQLKTVLSETNKDGETALMLIIRNAGIVTVPEQLKSKQLQSKQLQSILFQLIQHLDKTSQAEILKQKNKAGHDMLYIASQSTEDATKQLTFNTLLDLIKEQTKEEQRAFIRDNYSKLSTIVPFGAPILEKWLDFIQSLDTPEESLLQSCEPGKALDVCFQINAGDQAKLILDRLTNFTQKTQEDILLGNPHALDESAPFISALEKNSSILGLLLDKIEALPKDQYDLRKTLLQAIGPKDRNALKVSLEKNIQFSKMFALIQTLEIEDQTAIYAGMSNKKDVLNQLAKQLPTQKLDIYFFQLAGMGQYDAYRKLKNILDQIEQLTLQSPIDDLYTLKYEWDAEVRKINDVQMSVDNPVDAQLAKRAQAAYDFLEDVPIKTKKRNIHEKITATLDKLKSEPAANYFDIFLSNQSLELIYKYDTYGPALWKYLQILPTVFQSVLLQGIDNNTLLMYAAKYACQLPQEMMDNLFSLIATLDKQEQVNCFIKRGPDNISVFEYATNSTALLDRSLIEPFDKDATYKRVAKRLAFIERALGVIESFDDVTKQYLLAPFKEEFYQSASYVSQSDTTIETLKVFKEITQSQEMQLTNPKLFSLLNNGVDAKRKYQEGMKECQALLVNDDSENGLQCRGNFKKLEDMQSILKSKAGDELLTNTLYYAIQKMPATRLLDTLAWMPTAPVLMTGLLLPVLGKAVKNQDIQAQKLLIERLIQIRPHLCDSGSSSMASGLIGVLNLVDLTNNSHLHPLFALIRQCNIEGFMAQKLAGYAKNDDVEVRLNCDLMMLTPDRKNIYYPLVTLFDRYKNTENLKEKKKIVLCWNDTVEQFINKNKQLPEFTNELKEIMGRLFENMNTFHAIHMEKSQPSERLYQASARLPNIAPRPEEAFTALHQYYSKGGTLSPQEMLEYSSEIQDKVLRPLWRLPNDQYQAILATPLDFGDSRKVDSMGMERKPLTLAECIQPKHWENRLPEFKSELVLFLQNAPQLANLSRYKTRKWIDLLFTLPSLAERNQLLLDVPWLQKKVTSYFSPKHYEQMLKAAETDPNKINFFLNVLFLPNKAVVKLFLENDLLETDAGSKIASRIVTLLKNNPGWIKNHLDSGGIKMVFDFVFLMQSNDRNALLSMKLVEGGNISTYAGLIAQALPLNANDLMEMVDHANESLPALQSFISLLGLLDEQKRNDILFMKTHTGERVWDRMKHHIIERASKVDVMQLDHFIALLDTLTESERVDILTSAIPNGEEAVGVRMQRVNLLEGVVDPRLKTWMQQIEDLSLMDNALQQLKNIFKDDASMDHFMLIKSLKMGLFDSPHVLSKAQLKKILLSEEGLLETILSNHQDEKAAIAIRLLAFLTPEDQSLVINRSKLSLFNLAISHPNDMIFAAVVALIKKHPSPEVIINDGKGEASALSAILLTSTNMSTKLERINALLDLVPKEHLLDSFPSDFFIKLSSFRVRGFYQAGHFLNWMSQSTSSPEDIRRKKADLLRAIPHALHEALMNTYTIEREPPGVLLDCLVSTLDMHSQANVFRIYEKSKHRSEYSKEDYRIRKFNADEKRDYYLLELASDVVSLGREHAWLYEKMITLYNQLTRCMSALKNSENAQHHETSNAQRMQAIWTAKKQIRSGSYIHKLLTNLERSMQDDSFSINIREKSFQAQVEDKIKLDRVNEDKKQHENKSKWMDFYAAVQQRDPEFLKHFESSDGMLDTASIMEQGIRMQDINSNTNCNRLTETYVRFYAKFPYIIAQLSDVINTFSLDDQTAIFKQVEHQLSPEKWNDLNRILKEDQTVKDARLMDYFEPLSVDSAPLVAQTGTGSSNVPPQINAINNDAYQALLNFLKNKKEQQQHQQDDNPLVTAAKDDLDRIPVLLAAMKSLLPADQLLLLEDFSGHIRSILRENPLATKSPYLAQLVNDYAVLTNANDLNALREMVTTEEKLHHQNWNDFLDLDASTSTMQTQIQALKQKEIPLAIVKDKPLLIKLMALIKTFPRNEISAILKKNQQNLIFQVIHDPEAMAAVQSTMNASDEAGYIRDISLRYALRKTLDNGLSTEESVAAQSLLLTQTKELPEYAQQQILLGCLSQFRRMEHLAPLLAHIKELTYESQFNILKWFGSKHSIRWKTQSVTSQSPQAKRDYHLIELAAKAYAYQQQALQEKGAEKARYESAARYASALHATLNALTADEKNGPCTIVQTEADWLRAIDNAKRQFKEIDKEDNLEIKGLLRRLWGAIKRLTRAVLAPKTLLDELSAARPSHVYASPQVICLKSYPEMEKKFVAENTQGFWPLESAFCYSGAPISPETISQIVTEINQSVRQEDRIKILSHYICTMKNASFLIHTGLSQQMEPLAKKHLYLLELERITLDPKFTQHHQQKKLHSQLLSDLLAYERIKNPTPSDLLELEIKWVRAIEQSKIGQSSWSTSFFGRSTKPSCAEAFKATMLTMQQECISPETLNLSTTNKRFCRKNFLER